MWSTPPERRSSAPSKKSPTDARCRICGPKVVTLSAAINVDPGDIPTGSSDVVRNVRRGGSRWRVDRSPCGQGHHCPGDPPSWPTAGAVTGERRFCRVAAAYTVDAAAGRGAGTAEIDVLDGCFGATEAGRGPEDQLLVEL